jgi:hypothetical protein
MARPAKAGLEYFPFDVDFFEDPKLDAIGGEFGLKGEIATVKLLCAVYKNGYFVVWNDLLKMQLLKRLPGVSGELLEQIVNRLVLWGFFEKSLFNSDKVLTSNGIQKRYFEATKRRMSAKENVYVINNEVNADINPLASGINADKNPLKESKVKEEKTSTNVDAKKATTAADLDDVPDFIKENRQKVLDEQKTESNQTKASLPNRMPPPTLDELGEVLIVDREMRECLDRKYQITGPDYERCVFDFILEKKADHHSPASESDGRSHFRKWAKYWPENQKQSQPAQGKIEKSYNVTSKAGAALRELKQANYH